MAEMTGEKEDLVTIGVTDQGNAIIERLLARGWFDTDMGAFKVAVAYAIANDVAPTDEGRFQTKWNVGSLDRSGDLLDLVGMFSDNARPWDHVRRLGDAALKALEPRIDKADVPSDLFLSDSKG